MFDYKQADARAGEDFFRVFAVVLDLDQGFYHTMSVK
jgi:hypothetical protein